jgi:uncharacterized protein YpmS
LRLTTRYSLFWALAVLVLAGLACNLPGIAGGASPTPAATPLRSVEDELGAAATQIAAEGTVTLRLSEAQLTDMVNKDLREQSNPIFSNPQVALPDGQIQFSATVSQEGISLPLTAVLTITATAEGSIQYRVVEARLGPLPLPQAMLDELTKQMDEALAANLVEFTREVFVEEVAVRNRELIITGRRRN